MSILEERVIIVELTKLYVGGGHKAPSRMPQRSIVVLTGCMPNNRFAVTLTFLSTDAAEMLKNIDSFAAK